MSAKPTADVSVRVAWGDDAPGIAAVQVRAWRAAYADLLPADALGPWTPSRRPPRWRSSLVQPEDARNRVLVALERNRICGFAITGPASDPDCDPVADGEVARVLRRPRRAAQGPRLPAGAGRADTLVADRFTRAVTWLTSTDDVLREFLTGAGWAPDGAHRELDLHGDGSVLVKQVRLHTALA